MVKGNPTALDWVRKVEAEDGKEGLSRLLKSTTYWLLVYVVRERWRRSLVRQGRRRLQKEKGEVTEDQCENKFELEVSPGLMRPSRGGWR